ncbi:MAG TPA: DUF2490 domain-containing protein [Saprospiraceae bacterium]|nr:DUF2490 domain-containing protein [Saprospiraceae bacterium]
MGSWSIVNAKLNLNSHWSIWTEGQLRSIQLYDEFFYYEVKGGLTFNLKDHLALTAGVGRYATYTLGGNFEQPFTTEETRTWLQLVMEQKWDRINFEHRYRVEQRHLSTGYKNRFRYRLNAVIPINHPEFVPKTFYAYIGDEVFFTSIAPFYERNRFFTGLGYKVTKAFTIQSGYMRQYDYKLTSETSRDFLQVALLFNFRLEDFHKHSVPSTTD